MVVQNLNVKSKKKCKICEITVKYEFFEKYINLVKYLGDAKAQAKF